jgi:hypothetical protein
VKKRQKKHLKAKEALWKFQIFHHAKNINLPKTSPPKERNPKSFKISYYTLESIMNLNTISLPW